MGRRRSPAEFTPEERLLVLERDRWCLKCGTVSISLQHRRAKGMGGLSSKSTKLTCADGIALCMIHNDEAEGVGQDEALRYGWKIRRNSLYLAATVPFLDRVTGSWWLPDALGGREWVDRGWAIERVRAANGLG